jgi:hypothetical protein
MLDAPAPDAAEVGQCGYQWHAGAAITALGPHSYGGVSCRLRDLARLLRCQQCGTLGTVRVWLSVQ